MECANPSYLKNGRMYHWSNPYDDHSQLIFPAQKIDCRKCIHCRKNRGGELAHCCILEAQTYQDNHFITLTKKPGYEKNHPKFEKKEIKNFIKKVQRWCWKKHACTPKIYRVHEHGSGKTKRSHYHLVVFNLPLDDIRPTQRPDTGMSYTILSLWQHGHITVQSLNHATAMYQSLYLDKDLKNGHANSEKKSVSWHSGIGTTAFLKNYRQWLNLGYIPFGDKKQKIPRKFFKIAQKHLDAITLTNWAFCRKYMKKQFDKMGDFDRGLCLVRPKLCQINIAPNRELAEIYLNFKLQQRDQEKNNERMNQIMLHNQGRRKQMPDFHISGENTLYNQLKKLEENKL